MTVTILACGGEGPFVTFPSSEIQLVDESGGVRFCAGSLTADADTDAQGQTTFSGAIAGGGHGDVMVVRLGGVRLAPVIDLRFHSPDINGDLQVNLADVAEFATDFSGTYRFRSDFVHDGVLNLADIGVLARYVGEHCP